MKTIKGISPSLDRREDRLAEAREVLQEMREREERVDNGDSVGVDIDTIKKFGLRFDDDNYFCGCKICQDCDKAIAMSERDFKEALFLLRYAVRDMTENDKMAKFLKKHENVVCAKIAKEYY